MFRWNSLSIPRLYGLDLKTNVIDVKDGESLDCENVYQKETGVIGKRKGNSVLFDADEATALKINEIGTCTIGSTKYWFKFVDGKFRYSTSATGALTTLSPSPAISTSNEIWYAVIDSKLFFVDGTNALRYFDGSAIAVSSILGRPTVAPTTSGGTGFDYTFTVDNGLGESPALSSPVTDEGSGATVTIDDEPLGAGNYTVAVGHKLRVYSRVTSTLAQWRNVTPISGAHANGTYGSDNAGGYLLISSVAANYAIVSIALNGDLPILYTDLGVAVNASAPTGLEGISVHAGRLVGWGPSGVATAKVSNPHSWPSDTAQKEAFRYGFHQNDGEKIRVCISYRESLYVLKDTKVACFGGIGPDDTGNNAFTFRRIETNGIGCSSGKSAKVVGDDTSANYLVWQSREGFYASTGDMPIRVGEKIEGQIQAISLSNQRKSVAVYHKREGFYYCFVGTDAVKNGFVLDLRKDGDVRVGWFKLTDLNPTCVAWDDEESKYIFGDNNGFCAQERNLKVASDFSDFQAERVATSAVNTTSDVITTTIDYPTQTPFVIRSSGGVPAGLTANTTYYAIRQSATSIKVATSAANALAGTAVNITSQGSGTHTLVSRQAIAAYYTTNWIKFKDAKTVKKLSKPMVLLNAAATSVNLTMQIAVDWFESFFDPHTLTVTSDDAWGDEPWGSFVWGAGAVATPQNVAIARRKCRSIRYKFANSAIDEDFDLKGIEQDFAYIRNRGAA